MVRQPAVPHNTPKSGELRKSTRSLSKTSDYSADRQKQLKNGKHPDKMRKRSSKVSQLLQTSSSRNILDVHCSCERLHNEIHLFVSDFINSQEYKDYMDFKKTIIRKDEEVQYDVNDLKEVVDVPVPEKKKKTDRLRALSRRALRVFFLEVQIEKYLKDLTNAEVLEKQEAAIATIRQKISEVKEVFFCNREEELKKIRERKQVVIRNFMDRHNIDISKMISTKRLDRVILEVERKLRTKRRGHKNNTRSIIEKLVKEYNQNEKLKKKKEASLTNIKKKWNKQSDNTILHIEGRKGSQIMLSSVHAVRNEDALMKAFQEAGVCLIENQFESGNFWDKACLTESYHTSDKSLQASVMRNISLQIPQEDHMFKIRLNENAKQKLETMQSFVQFEDLLEARHFFCTCERERREKEKVELDYPDDQSIISIPENIRFEDFKINKIYSKKLILRNKTGNSVRTRFFKFHFEDIKYNINFEIDPDEMKIARPGLPVNLTVKFRPTKKADVILGHLIFLTCYESNYHKYMIPIECIPAKSEVMIEPQMVSFGTIPIWKFSKNIPKTTRLVKVTCCGKNPYKVIVKKVEDPLELETPPPTKDVPEEESSSSDDSVVVKKSPSQLEMESIIKDILKEVDCRFHFDRKFVVVDNQSGHQNLKISLSAIQYPGFYFERYQVDMYKVLKDEDEYQGNQVIAITLEVDDHFIKCEPICVDFGICFYGTAYQATFGISNSSKKSQFLSVRIPSLLNYYVSLDDSSVVVRSGETRKIAVKLLPSHDLMLNKCKYFDRDTSILYFPVEVRLIDKKYSSVPPTMEHCYAILNDCSDLTIDPQREHYDMFDGQMVLDMGVCSVSEAITTQIVLRNSSYSKRYYGFMNLPRYITILPNYGFGSINAFQEIILNIFIHPQVADFKVSAKFGKKFREDRSWTIAVDTVANLGKYRRKPNMNRLLTLMKFTLQEMKRTTNVEMLEDIFKTKGNIREEFNLCTCSTARLMKNSSTRTLEVLNEVVGSTRKDSYASSNPKLEENQTQDSKTSPKTRSSELLKQNSDVNYSMKNKSSDRSTIQQATGGLVEEPEEHAVERQPSLLQKKAVGPIMETTPLTTMGSVLNLAETMSRQLRLKMIFVKPLYEFSFNYMEYPVTPGGSYSIMTTELRPLKYTEKRCCGPEGKKARCRSTFRIAGSTQEIRIEPMYGVLEHGESIKLTLVATPKINEDVIAAYAYEDKRNTLFQAKMDEEFKKREEDLARKAKKNKTKKASTTKGKKEKSLIDIEITKIPEDDINIEISPEEVQLEYSDLYPAELALWRSIEPYFLNTKFVCRVDYEMDEPWSHDPDIFSLETVCKVVSPDFIHDQRTQRLDFGQVPIGDSKRKIVTIQNLRYQDIKVTTSILRPEGSFCCPNYDSVTLPSECFLKIPITYKPSQDESVREYMEIRAERTVYQFLLSAEAAHSNIRLEPSSKILRVVVKKGKLLEVPLEIVNDSRQPVRVTLEKICELKGKIIHLPSQSKSKSGSDQKLKKKTGKKGVDDNVSKTSGSNAKKKLSFSDELTEDEIYSIENEFSITKGSPYFHILAEDKNITLQESSKKTIKIQFGPNSSDTPKSAYNLKSKDRQKSDDVNDDDIGKTFVAKFNVLVGPSYFLRDFIILAEFK